MNCAEGTAASLAKQQQSFRFDMKERGRDLLQPFYQYENYAWWFDQRAHAKIRFGERKIKPKFDEVLMQNTRKH